MSTGQAARESPDLSPDFVYTSKGRVTDFGYEIEVRVPFKSLKYQSADVQTWDINVVRQVSVGTWVLDKDMLAAGSTSSGYFLSTPDLLFASAPPRVFTRNAAATWSTSLSDASLTHGMLI